MNEKDFNGIMSGISKFLNAQLEKRDSRIASLEEKIEELESIITGSSNPEFRSVRANASKIASELDQIEFGSV